MTDFFSWEDETYTLQLPPVRDIRTDPSNNFTNVHFDETLRVLQLLIRVWIRSYLQATGISTKQLRYEKSQPHIGDDSWKLQDMDSVCNFQAAPESKHLSCLQFGSSESLPHKYGLFFTLLVGLRRISQDFVLLDLWPFIYLLFTTKAPNLLLPPGGNISECSNSEEHAKQQMVSICCKEKTSLVSGGCSSYLWV